MGDYRRGSYQFNHYFRFVALLNLCTFSSDRRYWQVNARSRRRDVRVVYRETATVAATTAYISMLQVRERVRPTRAARTYEVTPRAGTTRVMSQPVRDHHVRLIRVMSRRIQGHTCDITPREAPTRAVRTYNVTPRVDPTRMSQRGLVLRLVSVTSRRALVLHVRLVSATSRRVQVLHV